MNICVCVCVCVCVCACLCVCVYNACVRACICLLFQASLKLKIKTKIQTLYADEKTEKVAALARAPCARRVGCLVVGSSSVVRW